MIDAIVDLLIQLNNLFGGQLGITLIVLGVAVRLVFFPMIKQQLEHAKKMQDLQPKLKELKKKYGDDKMRMAQEQGNLFKEAGINPAAGCLPMIVQIVVFGVLYNAIMKMLERGIPTHFLIWDLAKPDVIPIAGLPIPLPGILILLAAVSQLIMSKMMVPQPVAIVKEDKPKEVEEKMDLADELQHMQGSMMYLFPLMFIFFGYQFPAGLSLYWAASTVVSLGIQYKVHGVGGLQSWIDKVKR